MYILMPMGMINLMNLLKEQNFQVYAINVGLELSLDSGYRIKDDLEKTEFDIALIDLHWHEHAFGALELARLCKEIRPECYVVIGGFTASYFSDQIISDHEYVDFVISGDGEKPLLELVSATSGGGTEKISSVSNLTYRSSGKVITNPVSYTADDAYSANYSDITSLKHWEEYLKCNIHFYSRGQFWYSYWLCVAKGCVFDCSFCGGGKNAHQQIFNRNHLFFREKKQVTDNIRHLAGLGVHTVNFSHDIQMAGVEYWESLLSDIGKNDIDIGAYIELNSLSTPAFAEKFAETFSLNYSTLVFSPLSGNEEVRAKNGKGYSNSDLLKNVELMESLKIPYAVYFAAGFPFETEESFNETLELAEKLSSGSMLKMIFSTPLTLDPGSPMFNNPGEFGITPHFRSFKDYYERSRKRACGMPFDLYGYHTDTLSPGQMNSLQVKWMEFMKEKFEDIISNLTVSRVNFL